MSLVRPRLRGQAGAYALLFDPSGQLGRSLSPSSQAKPNHPRGTTASESSDLPKIHFDCRQRALLQRIGDRLDQRSVDATDEPDRQVKVLFWSPAKLRRHLRAGGDETRQLVALRLGHGQPEERADLQRTRVFFFQFS